MGGLEFAGPQELKAQEEEMRRELKALQEWKLSVLVMLKSSEFLDIETAVGRGMLMKMTIWNHLDPFARPCGFGGRA